jgi:hypothetical protein
MQGPRPRCSASPPARHRAAPGAYLHEQRDQVLIGQPGAEVLLPTTLLAHHHRTHVPRLLLELPQA